MGFASSKESHLIPNQLKLSLSGSPLCDTLIMVYCTALNILPSKIIDSTYRWLLGLHSRSHLQGYSLYQRVSRCPHRQYLLHGSGKTPTISPSISHRRDRRRELACRWLGSCPRTPQNTPQPLPNFDPSQTSLACQRKRRRLYPTILYDTRLFSSSGQGKVISNSLEQLRPSP